MSYASLFAMMPSSACLRSAGRAFCSKRTQGLTIAQGVTWLLIVAAPQEVGAAETYTVPVDYPTIQEALDATNIGDTVVVYPGTYFENLVMRDGVRLISRDGPGVTVLDGDHDDSVLRCESIAWGAEIRGFTIQNGLADLGGGIYCASSSMLIEGNVIRDNRAIGTSYGGGVYLTLCPPTMTLRSNTIYRNDAHIGGGVCCNGDDESTVVGNTIWGNTANFASGIISYNGSDILIANNIIAENQGGKGLYVHSSSWATIECNDVWANTPVNYHGEDRTGLDGNLSLDPLFCDTGAFDFGLLEGSPCDPATNPNGPECGLIGSRDSCNEPVLGACCFNVVECIITNASLCAQGGGIHQPGLTCDPSPCPPSGACCLESGECLVTGIVVCEQSGGILNIGQTCDPSPCSVPTGACCFEDGGCEVLLGVDCVESGGGFLGAETDCAPGNCDAASTPTSADAWTLQLSAPFPNPARDHVVLRFMLPERDSVELKVVDVEGRKVAEIVEGEFEAGPHVVRWEIPEIKELGVAIVVLRTSAGVRSQKIVTYE